MDFLYFPQDKSEYIPAFILLVIFMIAAIATVYLFYKKSKKDEKLVDEKYKDIYREAMEARKNNEQKQEEQ